jgi:hypothetical protein
MTMPHDPGQPPPPYYPPAPTVAKKRITGGAHTVHLVLTICTCGAWGIVWFLHWLFTRSKTTYR